MCQTSYRKSFGLRPKHLSRGLTNKGLRFDYVGSLNGRRTANRMVCLELVKMYNETSMVIPEPALIKVERPGRYGSVPGLDDSELAEPDELEKQVFMEQWGPILALPVKGRVNSIQPVIDESGGVDWGAFGTVDFDSYRPEFDKARYKADRLKERLDDIFITLAIVRERLPAKAVYLVLKYLQKGILQREHIVNDDMLAVVDLFMRTRRLQKEITELREASRRREERKLKVWLDS